MRGVVYGWYGVFHRVCVWYGVSMLRLEEMWVVMGGIVGKGKCHMYGGNGMYRWILACVIVMRVGKLLVVVGIVRLVLR